MVAALDQDATFLDVLGRVLVVRRDYAYGYIAEAAPLLGVTDGIYTRRRKQKIDILCLIDCDARPDAFQALGPAQVESVAAACLARARRAGWLPRVRLGLIFVGRGMADQAARPQLARYTSGGSLARMRIRASGVDPQARRAIGAARSGDDSWLRRLVGRPWPTAADLDEDAVATAPRRWPWLTTALLVLLVCVFAAELLLGLDPVNARLQPSLQTLMAFGALQPWIVSNQGQAWRLLTAPFLHAGLDHIALNGLALILAGFALEPLIGAGWLGAIYALGGLAGAGVSFLVNAPADAAVGASGAIVALLAAMLVLSWRFPPGPRRNTMQTSAAQVLLPALVPLATTASGDRIDYGAHAGGALLGLLVGLLLLWIWPRSQPRPPGRQVAAALAVLIALGSLLALRPAVANYHVFALQSLLAHPWPEEAEARAKADELAAAHPHDPRARYMKALTLMDRKAWDEAAVELKAALGEREILATILPRFEPQIRMLLGAVLVAAGKQGEAREAAAPACTPSTDSRTRHELDRLHLCAPEP